MDLQAAKLKMKLLVKGKTTEAKYLRGVKYYEEGRISQVKMLGNVAHAKIKGTRNYSLFIDLERYYGECSCPSDAPDEKCKHIVALALTLADDKSALPAPIKALNNEIKPEKEPKKDSKKTSKKTPVKPKSIYPKALEEFIKTASKDAQLNLFYQILALKPEIHATCAMLLQNKPSGFEPKKISSFLRKHKKVFESDFFGAKTQRSLQAITLYFSQLPSALTDDEKGYENRLTIAKLLFDEVLTDFSYAVLFDLYTALIDPVIDAFEHNPTSFLYLIEKALNEDAPYHPLWEYLIERGSTESRALIHKYIVESNFKKSPFFESSEACQKETLRFLIVHLSKEEDYFHEIINECDYVKDKDHYYRVYYEALQNPVAYLNYANSLDADAVKKYEIECLIELGEWKRLEAILDRLIRDTKYATNSWRHLPLVQGFKLKADVIKRLQPKQQSPLSDLYKTVKDHNLLDIKDKADFFWHEKQYKEMLIYFKWFRVQSTLANNWGLKSQDHKDQLLFYLTHFVQIDDPSMNAVFETLLEIEQSYLKETKSNNYDYTYDIVYHAYAHGLRDKIYDFIVYCAQEFPNRKKLIETLWDFAAKKDLLHKEEL